MEDDFFDPIYKGCTSPSTAFGVPILPFILGTLGFALISLWAFFILGLYAAIFFATLYAFAYGWARKVSRNDDQRLLQFMLKLRMRLPQIASRRFWGAISFSPLPPSK